ncbi:aminopeptidase N-like [Malaya genurostris]|uniref:aminopeptidase N-like n=1 Tax=Malaya genurostris TaxID=325434 RepID=UPI0026F3B879|nr:aminopeptidase N-like [Malaya genurostris]
MVNKLIIVVLVYHVFTINAQRLKLDILNLPMSELWNEATTRTAIRNFESYRLPNTSVPIHYNLLLDTNVHLDNFTFIGKVQIQLTTLENTKQLVLHSSGNEITNVQLYNSNQLTLPLKNFELDIEKEFLVINLKETLPAGSRYQLVVDFFGELRDDLLGFYRSYYVGTDGTTKHIAVTQFETNYARRAFPCFDEPGIRATFSISISCGLSYRATSNMPIAGITIQSNQKKLTRFRVTPRMSTYLVAFMVTDFVSKRVILKEPTRLTMESYARPSASDQLNLGLQKGEEAIRSLEQYCNQTYDLPKLDQVAVPDFFFGAMENWGLVKYGEQYLLYDENKSTNRDKENIINIIVHEFAHQFFGNLVTPKWWTDIFLSEGFATFYSYYIGAEIAPDIRFREFFTIEALQLALYADSMKSTRPLSYFVESNPISLFDVIAYEKGGSIFRMLNYALKEQTFQKGIRRYLQTNKDSAVDVYDLFESLQSAAKEDDVLPLGTTIETIMSPWIFQSGYPLVTVSRMASTNELVFEQEHFSEDVAFLRTWWIPINYHVGSQIIPNENENLFWLPQGVSQISVQIDIPTEAYVLVNPHQTGFYRVNYDTELWQRLISQLNLDHTKIPPVSRAQLIDDSIKLVRANKLEIVISFEIIKYLQYETDYIPWYAAFASYNLQSINNGLVVDEEAYQAFQIFLNSLTTTLLQTVGFVALPNEPPEHQRLRTWAIEWNCRMGSTTCRSSANQLMTTELQNTQRLPLYIRHSIYCGGLMESSEEQLDTVLKTFQESNDPTERSMLISALGCNENNNFLLNYLSLTLNGNLQVGEWQRIFRSVYSRNNIGFRSFLSWLELHSPEIIEKFGAYPDFVQILADIQSRTEKLTEFSALIDLLKADMNAKLITSPI